MKVIVCGSRHFHHGDRVDAVLDALHNGDVSTVERLLGLVNAAIWERVATGPISCIVTGAAPGADLCAEAWARSREIPYRGYPAKWKAQGKSAGPRRNAYMLECEHRPGKPVAVVLAFPGNVGTADCVDRARAAGIEVIEAPPTNKESK